MVILKSVDTFAVSLGDVLFISKNSKSLISTSILGHPNQEQLAERVRLLQKGVAGDQTFDGQGG